MSGKPSRPAGLLAEGDGIYNVWERGDTASVSCGPVASCSGEDSCLSHWPSLSKFPSAHEELLLEVKEMQGMDYGDPNLFPPLLRMLLEDDPQLSAFYRNFLRIKLPCPRS